MISVCVATYNGEKYIEEQLSSILKQLAINDEIIISDDGSTDNTVQVIENIKDERIKIYTNPFEKGYSKNFENAIINAIGDYIFLSDQDDVWMDYKVIKMIERLKSSTMVVSDALFVDEKLNKLNDTYFSLRGGRKGLLNNLYKSRYLGACMAFRKEMLTKLLPFPDNQILCPHDYWLTLVGELFYTVNVLSEPLIYYRRHSNNVSNGGFKSKNAMLKKVFYRAYSLFLLFKRIGKK